jgi:hypothetical protein
MPGMWSAAGTRLRDRPLDGAGRLVATLAIAASREQVGVIGIGFALMSRLFAAAIVIVVATAGGVTSADRLEHRGAP